MQAAKDTGFRISEHNEQEQKEDIFSAAQNMIALAEGALESNPPLRGSFFHRIQNDVENMMGERFKEFEEVDSNEMYENNRGSVSKVTFRVSEKTSTQPAFYRRATIMKPKDGTKVEILAVEEVEDEGSDNDVNALEIE